MPVPQVPESRVFYRAAIRRLDEAKFLLGGQRWTAAIYLAGYGIECMLKSLIVSIIPGKRRADAILEFRGRRAHSFEWLRFQYQQRGGAPFPADVAKVFVLVSTWDTDLRYETHEALPRDATAFLKNAEAIMNYTRETLRSERGEHSLAPDA
jgi:HEPN domain-containing protein